MKVIRAGYKISRDEIYFRNLMEKNTYMSRDSIVLLNTFFVTQFKEDCWFCKNNTNTYTLKSKTITNKGQFVVKQY